MRHRRRRVLHLLAASTALGLLPRGYPAGSPLRHRWRGTALGAEARIDLWIEDSGRAARLVRLCIGEIDRLERVFSLQRADSALSRLNRDGALSLPPLELVTVLECAGRVAALTGGAFDATVQPLWRLFADHFARPGCDPTGPSRRALERVGRLVDHTAVEVTPGHLRFARAGMAVTLNGIAQGFIADRLAALLREAGMASAFLDVGEIAAVGAAPGGDPWRVRAGAAGPLLDLAQGAAATSSPAALTFDPDGRLSHLLDPGMLRPCLPGSGATVVADSAMAADAVSTALAVRPVLAVPAGVLGVRAVTRHAPAAA